MHRYTALALLSALLSGLPLAAIAAPVQEVVPTDSFIAQHVGTAAQLHQQISLDPVVRRRLARHFHTSAPAVTRYIQDNLVLTKLKKAQRFQVYCISRTGREYTINSRLAAGTPVFVMRSTGQPVLKLACGNPMVASLPPVVTKVAAYHSPEIAPAPAPEAVPVALPLQSNAPVVVAMNDVPGVVVMPTTKVGGFIGQLPAVHGGGFPFGYLAAIPVIAVAATHHGGGSSPSIDSTGTTGTGTTGTGTGTTDTGTTGTGTTGTGTTGTGTTGTGTTGTGTTGTGTTGTGTTGTGTTGTTGTGTTGTGTTDTGTTGTGTTGTGTTGTTGTGTTGTTGTGTTGTTGDTGTGTGTTDTGTGNSSTGVGTTGTNSGTGTGVTPVPEPSTPAAFAVGGLFLLFLLGGAKRRSRRKAR